MKYINVERLRRAVEKKYNSNDTVGDSWDLGYDTACKQILEIIDSLQQEQKMLPGIDERGILGKDFIPVEWVDACERYGKWKIVRQEQPEVDLEQEITSYFKGWTETNEGIACHYQYVNLNTCHAIARHFYELGLNAGKEKSKWTHKI